MFSWTSVISVQFSFSVIADSLRPHELQRARPPCPSPIPRVYSNSCPLSQWYHPTISPSVVPLLLLPSIFPSIRVFSNESVLCIRWPKYWSHSFSISPSSEDSGLISFRMDWLDLLARFKKRKKKFFVIRTFRIYYLNNIYIYIYICIKHTVAFIILIMLYLTSLVLIYLVTVKQIVSFNCLHPIPFLTTPSDHKYDIFLWACFFVLGYFVLFCVVLFRIQLT